MASSNKPVESANEQTVSELARFGPPPNYAVSRDRCILEANGETNCENYTAIIGHQIRSAVHGGIHFKVRNIYGAKFMVEPLKLLFDMGTRALLRRYLRGLLRRNSRCLRILTNQMPEIFWVFNDKPLLRNE